jgi:hypothetical protein
VSLLWGLVMTTCGSVRSRTNVVVCDVAWPTQSVATTVTVLGPSTSGTAHEKLAPLTVASLVLHFTFTFGSASRTCPVIGWTVLM